MYQTERSKNRKRKATFLIEDGNDSPLADFEIKLRCGMVHACIIGDTIEVGPPFDRGTPFFGTERRIDGTATAVEEREGGESALSILSARRRE